MIGTPSPPSTLGRFEDLQYTRRPGLEMRRIPAIERSRFGPYLRSIVALADLLSASATVHPAMNLLLEDLGDVGLDLAVRHRDRVG